MDLIQLTIQGLSVIGLIIWVKYYLKKELEKRDSNNTYKAVYVDGRIEFKKVINNNKNANDKA